MTAALWSECDLFSKTMRKKEEEFGFFLRNTTGSVSHYSSWCMMGLWGKNKSHFHTQVDYLHASVWWQRELCQCGGRGAVPVTIQFSCQLITNICIGTTCAFTPCLYVMIVLCFVALPLYAHEQFQLKPELSMDDELATWSTQERHNINSIFHLNRTHGCGVSVTQSRAVSFSTMMQWELWRRQCPLKMSPTLTTTLFQRLFLN